MERGHAANIQPLLSEERNQPLFVRITGYCAQAEQIIIQLFDRARKNGVVIEGRIPNPTPENMAYYGETMGQAFQLDEGFILRSLGKWLPRMNAAQQQTVAHSLLRSLRQMERAGKTESIIRNAYVRFMCWLYFRFERIAVCLGTGKLPLVLYQGDMSSSELNILSILCEAGCDVAAILPGGDAAYAKADPRGDQSDLITFPGSGPFPADYSINAVYKAWFNTQNRPAQRSGVNIQHPGRPAPASAAASSAPVRSGVNIQHPNRPAPGASVSARPSGVNIQHPNRPASGSSPSQGSMQRPAPQPAPTVTPRPAAPQALRMPQSSYTICPNAWMDGDPMECLMKAGTQRSSDPNMLCSCFIRRAGVEDRLTYPSELIDLQQKLLQIGRKPLIVDEGFAPPTPEEIQGIRRRNYQGMNEALNDLAENLRNGTTVELQPIVIRAFMEILSAEGEKQGSNVNRIANTAVYLLVWYKRVYARLFEGWRPGKTGCLIRLGACTNEREALFLRFLSRTPTDVLLLAPNLEDVCTVQDPLLLEQRFGESLNLTKYPQPGSLVTVSTAAASAERELDSTLYNGTGLYRNRQFDAAQALILSSTYEEIAIYWEQELKYRPNFSTANSTVMMPVIFAQASGVKNGNQNAYWAEIKKLLTPDTFVVKQFPFFKKEEQSPMAANAVDFYRNGRLQRDKIRSHRSYPFAILREEVQEHILSKLEQLIHQKVIKGTGENGTEYQIISTVLSLNKQIIRMIQKFDFTKVNPKIVCISTTEEMASKEDAILLAFLSLVGFDVVVFVPTGYQCFTHWYQADMVAEHQLGDYVYDLRIPDFSTVTQRTDSVWNRFRRGR